ncbi:MAG: type II toxin-antitoxin system RelE/ParE family toxin [Terracoccus sp.]|uniref:type II toxin-antitoxin system RelE/ParE family toxin n=1 Tax=Humibacillus sp. DSM 29435 TaxID=1869167 RepID=UPI0008726351|nr:type II toxin-antitoxin system RelE/ParE family toxin [Humibacillus sp. DSM 29435]OFE17394.1 plasmid stabilization protein [Humibacillus sp. DSM 29435]
MTYRVRFAREAADQLEDLYGYISRSATPAISAGYVDAIVEHCEGLAVFPHRGQSREDLRPGLRTVSYRKRVVIAFSVDEAIKQVTILGVFYGGQDYESSLSEPDE